MDALWFSLVNSKRYGNLGDADVDKLIQIKIYDIRAFFRDLYFKKYGKFYDEPITKTLVQQILKTF
jgi:hypothetical protein